MDMKRILQAIDSASNKSEIISEGRGPLNRPTTAEAITMQHYTTPVQNIIENNSPSVISKYFKAVEEELNEAAERGKDSSRQLAERVSTRINELSTDTLASYKKKAGADASKADKEGNFKRGDKRFGGIVKATKKQFSNDAKDVAEVFSNDKETGTTHKGGVVTKTAHGIKHTKTDYDDGHGERGRKPSDKGPASRYKQTPILDKDDDDLSEGLEELFNLRNKVEEAIKQRLDPKCWTGKHKEGTKIKGGVRVNNCVPNESIEESKERCMQCGMKGCTCTPGKCKCKPVASWIPGKGFKKAVDEAANAAQQAAIAIAKKKEAGVAEGPTDDPRFQKMMGKIQKSTPTPMSGYVALSFANEGRSKKIKGVKHNGKPMPDVIDDPEEFLGGNIEFTPDQIEQKLMAIGEKYGWDSIDPGQGQGYTEMFFDTSREYTSKNQSRLAANIVRTVNEINKFFNSINRSLQSTGLPGYTTDVWQGMGPSDDINQIEDLTQIISIAKKQGIEEGSTQKDMNGQTCEKCKKDKYQERSQHDDMEGKVTCSCGNRVNRWKNYKEKDVAEGREGKDLDKIRDKYNKYDEAANPAQQAAIAIAKKKAGKK